MQLQHIAQKIEEAGGVQHHILLNVSTLKSLLSPESQASLECVMRDGYFSGDYVDALLTREMLLNVVDESADIERQYATEIWQTCQRLFTHHGITGFIL